MRTEPTFFPPYIPHTDQQVMAAVRSALGLPAEDQNIANGIASLLEARGFSKTDQTHYFRVFAKLTLVNRGQMSVENFASWFDETFPGDGVWHDETEAFEGKIHLNAFAGFIKDLRLKLGLTRTELACRVGVAPSQINRWEDGEGMPRDATLVQLGLVLGHNPARLWALANNVEV